MEDISCGILEILLVQYGRFNCGFMKCGRYWWWTVRYMSGQMWTWYWLKVREILNVKCEICHVVMEGKGYLQVCGKDICDLLEETLVVKIWRYWWWNLEVISRKVRYMILLCERYISDRVWEMLEFEMEYRWHKCRMKKIWIDFHGIFKYKKVGDNSSGVLK